jgi:hypothetical protein
MRPEITITSPRSTSLTSSDHTITGPGPTILKSPTPRSMHPAIENPGLPAPDPPPVRIPDRTIRDTSSRPRPWRSPLTSRASVLPRASRSAWPQRRARRSSRKRSGPARHLALHPHDRLRPHTLIEA